MKNLKFDKLGVLKNENNEVYSADLVRKQVFNILDERINKQQFKEEIKNEVELFSDFYKVDDRFYKIFEITVDERLGTNMQKQLFKVFNFNLLDYQENYYDYIEYADWIIQYVNNWIEKNLDFEGFYLDFGYIDNIGIGFQIILDYDYIPPTAKENFITGLDIDLLESLESGVSAFINDYDNIVFLYSIFDYDTEKYLYEVIPEQTKNDIIDDYKEYLIEETDVNNLQEELKRLDTIEGRVWAVYELQRYYGGFFNYLQSAENHIELLQKAGVC